MRLLQQIHGLRGLLGYQQINRFLIAASCLGQLLKGTTTIQNFLRAEDCLSTFTPSTIRRRNRRRGRGDPRFMVAVATHLSHQLNPSTWETPVRRFVY